MLYNLLTSYSDTYSFLNFFNFLTVRTGLAVITVNDNSFFNWK